MAHVTEIPLGISTPKSLPYTYKKGFVAVPVTILKASNIPAHLKLLYMVLLSYAWKDAYCFPGQQRLANDLNISRRRVIDQLKELQKLNLVYKIKRRGKRKTNVYVIVDRAFPQEEHDVSEFSLFKVNSASQELYTDEVNKHNLTSAFPDKVGQSPAGEITNPISKARPIINMYYSRYKEVIGTEHPRLVRAQIKRVALEMMSVGEEIGFDLSDYDWEIIIDCWFEGVMETDYNINHFASRKIISNIYYSHVQRGS